mmetsp:Transcript_66031/g.99535  ORF Transcript_66031/g.99535 Transcript_66031/m.99535 type:complete len:468 (-) Transcript_66031:9-1412(-)
MWELPPWYGTCLVCMMLATTLSLILEESAYKSAALMFGSILNINVIVLLFAICLPPDDEEVDGDGNSADAERAQGRDADAATSTEDHPAEQPRDPSGSDAAALGGNFHNPNKHHDNWFLCCCSRFSYPCFFVLTVLLSILVSIGTFPRLSNHTVVYFFGWEYVVFLISHGALLLSSLISWVKRGYLGNYIGFFSLPASKRGEDDTSREENLLQSQNGQASPSRTSITLSCLLGVTCFTLAGIRYSRVKTNLHSVNSFSDAHDSTYVGEAHVTGFTLLDFAGDDDDDNAWCPSRMESYIPVNVTVAWGGSWGCPNSGVYCESEVTTEVPCLFDLRGLFDDDDYDDDAAAKVDRPETAYDYINYRYHGYHSGDDDEYDEYAFDYDPTTQPQSTYWNKQSEFIYGDCDACEARSNTWMMEQSQLVSSYLHFGYMLIGMGLVFIGWPLMEYFPVGEQIDIDEREESWVEVQ